MITKDCYTETVTDAILKTVTTNNKTRSQCQVRVAMLCLAVSELCVGIYCLMLSLIAADVHDCL